MNKSIDLSATSKVFGLGDKGYGLNKRGQIIELWNKDQYPNYKSMTFFIIAENANEAVGYFIDSSEKLIFDFGVTKKNKILISSKKDFKLKTYFGDINQVMEKFTKDTGRVFIPPAWSLGFAQSRYGYKTQDEVLEIAEKYVEKDIPLSAIYLDIFHLDEYNPVTWNKDDFPHPEDMIKMLGKMGIMTVVIADPGIKNLPSFAKKAGSGRAWAGDVDFPDFTDQKTKAWWSQQLRSTYIDKGVAGIWNDMNEPADFSRVGKTAKIKNHNKYALGMAEAAKDSGAEFVLTRAAYVGIQQHAAVWTGDNCSSWNGLQESLPMCLGLSMSGAAFCGADVGGFMDNANDELFARWIQLGAFMPLFRAHSNIASKPHEAWEFGERTEKIARKYIKLRKNLIPYIQDVFKESNRTGKGVIRPMFVEFDDKECFDITDQFMFGSQILVAPILSEGATKRVVYLPQGTWRDIETNEEFSGDKYIVADAPLEKIPVYMKM